MVVEAWEEKKRSATQAVGFRRFAAHVHFKVSRFGEGQIFFQTKIDRNIAQAGEGDLLIFLPSKH